MNDSELQESLWRDSDKGASALSRESRKTDACSGRSTSGGSVS